MKSLLLLSTLAIATAVEIDWTKVRPIEELDHYWDGLTEELQALRYVQRSPRIINGNVADVGQFPYHVVLVSSFTTFSGLCGASLLTKNYILTAAHCVVDSRGGLALMGVYNRTSNRPLPQIRDFGLSDVAVHPNYTTNTMRNDVATIRMSIEIVINDNVRPIRLPASDDQRTFEGMDGTVAGYGRISTDNQDSSEVLRYITNSIITNVKCLEIWEDDEGLISAQNICLLVESGRATCNGDSGGALTISENGEALQVGIASFRDATCIEMPSVYARVSYFRSWIVANSDYNSATERTAKLSIMAVALFFVLFIV